MKEPLLLALIGLFLVVLVFRAIKAYFFARSVQPDNANLPRGADATLIALMKEADGPGKARQVLRDISRRAPGAKTPFVRSVYYCAAGNLAISKLKRPGPAVAFYLKALRANPLCIEAIGKLQEILTAQKRFRRLEWTYWEVLGRLDDTEVGSEIWIKCWSGLAAIYAASPRTVRRADAIRKALSVYMSVDEDEVQKITPVPDVIPKL